MSTRRQRARRRWAYLHSQHCCLCGEFVAPDKVTLEHIIPRSRGGTDDKLNCAVAHERCNVKRDNKLSPAEALLWWVMGMGAET